MTVQVFRKRLNLAKSPAALTLGLFRHHTAAVATDDAPALYLLIKKA
jgi:hypothetical protein